MMKRIRFIISAYSFYPPVPCGRLSGHRNIMQTSLHIFSTHKSDFGRARQAAVIRFYTDLTSVCVFCSKEPYIMDKSNASPSSIGHKLWNKIAKTQSLKMASQFIPVINEVFGTHYPMDTPVRALPSRYPVPKSRSAKKYPYIEPDLNLLIDGREHYHFEVQMSNDKMIGIRITEYGFHHGLMHGTQLVRPGIGRILFPHSAVLYLGEHATYPADLETTLVLPDRTQLRHTARGVRVQDYSLEEIHRKHLLIFLPFSLIRLRPKLKNLTKEELTEFINSIIFILNRELQDAFISEVEYEDYMQMVYDAASQILVHHPALLKHSYRE